MVKAGGAVVAPPVTQTVHRGRSSRRETDMATKFELPDELVKRIVELQSDLSSFATEMRDAFEERSERWRDSERGDAAGAWIEAVENLADELDNIDRSPEGEPVERK